MSLQFTFPYDLVPTRVVSYKLQEYPVDVVVSGGFIETRTLSQTNSGAFAELNLQFAIADCCKVIKLIEFWAEVRGIYSAFSIPTDHGIWAQILGEATFRANIDNAWRFNDTPVIRPLTDSLAAWDVTLKQLIYEDITTN